MEGDRFHGYRIVDVRRMIVRSYGTVGLLLLGLALLPRAVSAQQSGSEPPQAGFELEQNYPNPFNPETRVPFVLGDELFVDGRPARVTMRIFNVLRQFVASPTALGHITGDGVPIEELEYDVPGRYEAYWDGTDRSGAQVASGVYFVQLIVNGQTQIRKMIVTK